MVRINTTENEKLASNVLGNTDYTTVNMNEKSIDSLLEKERAAAFNSEVEKYNELLEKNKKDFNESKKKIDYDINQAEIKPLFSRVIVQPFKVNPFQQMKIENGIIVDTGGYTPHIQFNERTGKNEEQEQFIIVGCVVEVGPDVKYLKEGDCIYYRRDTAVPVPFFKQGFVSLDEHQIIATVNENLQERFDNIKDAEHLKDTEFVDLADIPECLGKTVVERLMTYKNLKENGIKILNKHE